MNKLFIPLLFSCLIVAGCLPPNISTDEDKKIVGGITIESTIEREVIVSNPMAAGETYSNDYVIELGDEFEERFGISLDEYEVVSFKMDYISTKFNKDQCGKLGAIYTAFDIPGVEDPVIFDKDGEALDDACVTPQYTSIPIGPFYVTLFYIDENDDEYGHVFEKDFSEQVNNRERVLVSLSLTAEEELQLMEEGSSFSIRFKAEYKPK